MTTAEERKRILEMVKEGKISAEEGARLLQALAAPARKAAPGRDARWMRVKVTDLKTGAAKVSVNIPMSLVSVGMKMGARFAPRDANIDYPGVMEALRSGTVGKIVDINDDGERVEIWVE